MNQNEADLTTKEQLTPEILASLINSINASSTCGECYFLDKVSTKTLDTIYLSESENFQIFDALNLCQILILEWSDKTSITKMFLLLDILVDIELYEVRQQLKKFSKVSLLLFTKLKKVTEVVENIALQSHCFQSRTTMSKRGNRVTSDELDDESSESIEFNACTECVLPRQTYLQVVLKIYKVSKDVTISTKFDDENFSKKFNEKLLEIVFSLLKTPIDEIEKNVKQNMQKQTYRQFSETLSDYFSVMFPQLDWRVKEMRAGLTIFLKKFEKLLGRITTKPGLRRKLIWRPFLEVIKGMRLLMARKSVLLGMQSIFNIIEHLLIILLDNYQIQRTFQDGVMSQMPFRSGSETSPKELKLEIIDFLVVVDDGFRTHPELQSLQNSVSFQRYYEASRSQNSNSKNQFISFFLTPILFKKKNKSYRSSILKANLEFSLEFYLSTALERLNDSQASFYLRKGPFLNVIVLVKYY